MKRRTFIFHLLFFICFLAACAPTVSSVTPQVVIVYSTEAALPWLVELYPCAADLGVALYISVDSPDIFLRLGQPADLATPAFQIDTEDILVVVNKQSPLGNLTLAQVRIIFAGQGDPSVQVWAYASDADTQGLFETAVMDGRSVASFARLAVSARQMSEALSADANAVGILPRRWMTDQLRELFVAASVPVLALTPSEPAGSVRDLIACLQKDD